jgi:hypothetical protein
MATLAEILRQTGYSQNGTLAAPAPTEPTMTSILQKHIASLPQKFNENQAEQMAMLQRAFPDNTLESADPKVIAEMAMQVPIVGMTKAALPRKELIAKQVEAIEETGRAKAGGQVADTNGFFYKGGQFLPNTNAEPGKWKINGKWVKSGTELIEPGVRANAPTPFSRSILSPLREYVDYVDNDFKKLKLKEGMKVLGKTGDDGLQHYEPVTAETTWTPRLADYEHHTPLTIGELIDAYNKGQRWFDVKPNAVTITTK